MRPSSWHIHSDNFGVWPYISSEYSREREELAKQKRVAHSLQVSDKDFFVPNAALPVKGLCCFGNYDYDLNPYAVCLSSVTFPLVSSRAWQMSVQCMTGRVNCMANIQYNLLHLYATVLTSLSRAAKQHTSTTYN